MSTVISFGQTSSGLQVRAGDTDIVLSGGTVIDSIVHAAGRAHAPAELVVRSGGLAERTLVSGAHASEIIAAGGRESGGTNLHRVRNGGMLVDETTGRDAITVTVAGGVERHGTVDDDGSNVIRRGGTAIDTTVSGGALLFEADAVASGAVRFAGSDGVLSIDADEGRFGGVIEGFLAHVKATGNTINLQGFGARATVKAVAANTLLVTSGGASLTLDVAGVVAGERFTVVADHATGVGVDIVPCFLEGTRILAVGGEVAVEELRVGELVETLAADGSLVSKPVAWIGRRAVLSQALPEGARHPVRIREGAFADAVPKRDLLVTPEHCVLVDGRLVPVRMLVNDRSIVKDHGINAYTIYHVELPEHSVLIADGLPTESYLDTGNRARFGNAQTTALRHAPSLNMRAAAWNEAAAPLSTARGFVEPIWRRLLQRAVDRGVALSHPKPAMTHEPDLHLVTPCGLQIRPLLFDGSVYGFVVPAGAGSLRLRSRASRPSDSVGPFVDDRRRLGVLVGRIGLGVGTGRVAVTAHLDVEAVPGWHSLDCGASCRWTDGDAALELPPELLDVHAVCIDIQVLGGGPYAVTAMAEPEARRSA